MGSCQPRGGRSKRRKGYVLQADRSAMLRGKHDFGVRETSGPILTQEGHTAMQVGLVPPFVLLPSGICIFMMTVFCFEEGSTFCIHVKVLASTLLFVICLFLHLLHLPRTAPRQALIISVPSAQYREDQFQAFAE